MPLFLQSLLVLLLFLLHSFLGIASHEGKFSHKHFRSIVVFVSTLYASSIFPSFASLINVGISFESGHPLLLHGFALQFKQYSIFSTIFSAISISSFSIFIIYYISIVHLKRIQSQSSRPYILNLLIKYPYSSYRVAPRREYRFS